MPDDAAATSLAAAMPLIAPPAARLDPVSGCRPDEVHGTPVEVRPPASVTP